MNELDFRNKTVLVVGGSSGIGNGIARAFHARGAEVHVWGTRASAADYADEPGSDLNGLVYRCVDVSNPETVANETGLPTQLDVLVLAQGTVVYKRGEFESDGWDRVMAVNLDSLRTCAMKCFDALATSQGSLIIISSVSAFKGNRGNPAYSASKAAAVALTRTLGEAWAGNGIAVNGIAPGLVDTKLTKVTMNHPKRRDAALAAIPAGRIGTPADMAGAALFLASPLAAYIRGQTLVVDGGLTLS